MWDVTAGIMLAKMDARISALPDLLLEMIFLYLTVHHLCGRGEVGDPPGVVAVCSRWHLVISRRQSCTVEIVKEDLKDHL